MLTRRVRGALAPLLDRLDGGARAVDGAPTPLDEGTRYPASSWDLRTLIAVFGPDDPFRYLNLNVLIGMTGLPFDQHEGWSGPPHDAFDLQLCLEGRGRAATYKRLHSVSGELDGLEPGGVRFGLGERLQLEGRWPRYTARLRQPEDDLELDMTFESRDGVQWWARSPRMYGHYTTFGRLQLAWRWGGERGSLETPALHDHGWGGNLLPLRLPLGVFRYEVLRLPDGGHAIPLWTEGPGRFTLRNVGLIRRPGGKIESMPGYACLAESPEAFENHAGAVRYVPASWTGHLSGPDEAFRYHARRATPPRPVLGDGFLHAFDYEGDGSGLGLGAIAGEGYVEQMGLTFAKRRRVMETAPGLGD